MAKKVQKGKAAKKAKPAAKSSKKTSAKKAKPAKKAKKPAAKKPAKPVKKAKKPASKAKPAAKKQSKPAKKPVTKAKPAAKKPAVPAKPKAKAPAAKTASKPASQQAIAKKPSKPAKAHKAEKENEDVVKKPASVRSEDNDDNYSRTEFTDRENEKMDKEEDKTPARRSSDNDDDGGNSGSTNNTNNGLNGGNYSSGGYYNKIAKPQPVPQTADTRTRYNDSELQEFKELILKKLDEAYKDYELLKSTLSHKDENGTDDTSPTFKLLEDGSDVLSKEETAHLAARQEKFIQSLQNALIRIENKTYGICRVTGKLISKERLRSVPHATLSIDAKLEQNNF